MCTGNSWEDPGNSRDSTEIYQDNPGNSQDPHWIPVKQEFFGFPGFSRDVPG